MRRKHPRFLNAAIGFLFAFSAAGCEAVDDLSATLSEGWSRLTAPDAASPATPESPKEAPVKTAGLVPQKLIGLDQRQVQDLLGVANRTREVSPAVVWEYRTKGCGLDVFFYLDLASQRFRALAYDIKRTDGSDDRTLAFCLDLIKEQKGGGKG